MAREKISSRSRKSGNFTFMYRFNQNFNIPPTAGQPLRAFDFFENYYSNSLLPGPKMPFKCPTLGSIQVIKCPHPGDISQAQNDRRTAETPSVVEQNLYKYNKNTVSVFTTNKKLVQSGRNRCYKVTECSAFLHHATSKGFYKKDPTY